MHMCNMLPQKYVNSFMQGGSPYTKNSSDQMYKENYKEKEVGTYMVTSETKPIIQ